MHSSARTLAIVAAAALAGCSDDITQPATPAATRSLAVAAATSPTEADAVAISQVIQQRHWPYLTLS